MKLVHERFILTLLLLTMKFLIFGVDVRIVSADGIITHWEATNFNVFLMCESCFTYFSIKKTKNIKQLLSISNGQMDGHSDKCTYKVNIQTVSIFKICVATVFLVVVAGVSSHTNLLYVEQSGDLKPVSLNRKKH